MAYILPRETKYIVENKIKIMFSIAPTKNKPAKISLDLGNVAWMLLSDLSQANLSIKNKLFKVLEPGIGGYAEFTGTVFNDTNFDFSAVDVYAILYNKSRQPITINRTLINDLQAKEERDFKMTWSQKIEGLVDSFEIEAKTNVFANDNFLKRYGNGQQFQEF